MTKINKKLTGGCADIICAINAANGLSAGAVLGAVVPPPVLLVVVVVAGAVAVVEPADVELGPVVVGGMKGNPSPPLNTHTQTKLIRFSQIHNNNNSRQSFI